MARFPPTTRKRHCTLPGGGAASDHAFPNKYRTAEAPGGNLHPAGRSRRRSRSRGGAHGVHGRLCDPRSCFAGSRSCSSRSARCLASERSWASPPRRGRAAGRRPHPSLSAPGTRARRGGHCCGSTHWNTPSGRSTCQAPPGRSPWGLGRRAATRLSGRPGPPAVSPAAALWSGRRPLAASQALPGACRAPARRGLPLRLREKPPSPRPWQNP